MQQVKNWGDAFMENVKKVFKGGEEPVIMSLVSVLARGHILIEDVPGTGKSVLARAIAALIGGKLSHIQCTPDLLPSDILGVSIFDQHREEFVFRQGPVVANILLVDEINRATPRTQSALLEVMAEGQVTVEGRTVKLPDPFILIATQSSVDFEGTFPLPEVQKDRFFLTLTLGFPDRESERMIMADELEHAPLKPLCSLEELLKLQAEILKVHVDERIKNYIYSLIHATREDSRLHLGISPRGTLALHKGAQALAALCGRDYIIPEDVKRLVPPVLRLRILLSNSVQSKGTSTEHVIDSLLQESIVPGYE